MSGSCNIFNLEKRYIFDDIEQHKIVEIEIKILFVTITISYRKKGE